MILLGLALFSIDPKTVDLNTYSESGPMYNARYCEILLADLNGVKLEVDVYNTMRCNSCPQAAWESIDLEKLADSKDVRKAIANGPRYTLMDRVTRKDGGPMDLCGTELGGLEMSKVASITMPLGRKKRPYQKLEVKRSTIFHFEAGRTVQILKSPEGECYIMQSYSQMVDKDLKIDDLESLDERLKLPNGWSYQSMEIGSDLNVETEEGLAVVVQDELKNTYQYISQGCLE